MVAYNFQKPFIEAIERGDKTHTIRKPGKRAHAQPGQTLQLYYAQRTKQCRKIMDAVCSGCYVVNIAVAKERLSWISLLISGNTHSIENLELFATDDGFESLEAMHAFWLDFHGPGLFEGFLIDWGQFSPERYRLS